MEGLKNKIHIRVCVFTLMLYMSMLMSVTLQAQFVLYDTITPQPKKTKRLALTGAAAYSASMLALHQVWYKENARQSFHFFNDAAEWKQVDKAGHFYTAFYLSSLSAKALNQCGQSSRQSILLGSLTGLLVISSIEIFDGYSAAYGASASDLLANATGSLFYYWQQSTWNEIRIQPKFSFHRTNYAPLRPAVLGDGLATEIIKDYNGQTYWLSIDADRWTRMPAWLNLAIGYGAEGMVYARDHVNLSNGFTPKRQYYLSVDFDLKDIPTRSKTLKWLFKALSVVKLPAPALAFHKGGMRFHPIYF